MTKTEQFELEDRVQCLEAMNSRLRLKNEALQNELEVYQYKASQFSAKTLRILQGLGLKFETILQLYSEQVPSDSHRS